MKSRGARALVLGVAAGMLSWTIASNEVGVRKPGREPASEPTALEAAYAHPVNLTVLEKDTRPAALKALMNRYAQDLGVQCSHCHVEDPQTHRIDYVSDENPAKEKARLMITMLEDINTKYLSQLDDPRYTAYVSCGNCHQGQSDPPSFEPTPRAMKQ